MVNKNLQIELISEINNHITNMLELQDKIQKLKQISNGKDLEKRDKEFLQKRIEELEQQSNKLKRENRDKKIDDILSEFLVSLNQIVNDSK